jgi:hypothetical protein
MTRKLDIEARLERSLVNQVKAPKLGRKFDASVWARIEAQSATNPALGMPRASNPARWLMISNAIGGAITLVLIVYFGALALGPVEVNVPVVSAPEISATTIDQISRLALNVITGASLIFALMFTSLGRRLRSELQQYL